MHRVIKLLKTKASGAYGLFIALHSFSMKQHNVTAVYGQFLNHIQQKKNLFSQQKMLWGQERNIYIPKSLTTSEINLQPPVCLSPIKHARAKRKKTNLHFL